jgi:hypothetical protein
LCVFEFKIFVKNSVSRILNDIHSLVHTYIPVVADPEALVLILVEVPGGVRPFQWSSGQKGVRVDVPEVDLGSTSASGVGKLVEDLTRGIVFAEVEH